MGFLLAGLWRGVIVSASSRIPRRGGQDRSGSFPAAALRPLFEGATEDEHADHHGFAAASAAPQSAVARRVHGGDRSDRRDRRRGVGLQPIQARAAAAGGRRKSPGSKRKTSRGLAFGARGAPPFWVQ